MARTIISLFFALLYLQSIAQENSTLIFTDRPNASDATGLISHGDLQAEIGYFMENDVSNNQIFRNSTMPNVSIKYGLLNWLEIRFLSTIMTQAFDDGTQETKTFGITPITFSPKFKIMDREGFFSKLSATTSFTFPNVGSPSFQNKKLNPGVRLLMENSINKSITWTHNFGSDWDDNSDANWIYTSSFSFALTDKIGAFTELYGKYNTTNNSYYWDGGLTYLLKNNLCADVMVGAGLHPIAYDYFLSVGFAWKTNLKND